MEQCTSGVPSGSVTWRLSCQVCWGCECLCSRQIFLPTSSQLVLAVMFLNSLYPQNSDTPVETFCLPCKNIQFAVWVHSKDNCFQDGYKSLLQSIILNQVPVPNTLCLCSWRWHILLLPFHIILLTVHNKKIKIIIKIFYLISIRFIFALFTSMIL